jgi:hypothetical protein
MAHFSWILLFFFWYNLVANLLPRLVLVASLVCVDYSRIRYSWLACVFVLGFGKGGGVLFFPWHYYSTACSWFRFSWDLAWVVLNLLCLVLFLKWTVFLNHLKFLQNSYMYVPHFYVKRSPFFSTFGVSCWKISHEHFGDLHSFTLLTNW